MKNNTKKYKRLPGRKRKFVGKDTIWAGADHMLLVESTGMSEDYKRFYYKDIQSISITRTKTEIIKNSFISVLALLFFLMASSFLKSEEGLSIFLFIISSVFFLFLIINLIQGASCICWITTAVQRIKLKPVNRCRQAVKMMTIIGPRIEQVQGVLPLNELGERMNARAPSADVKKATYSPGIPVETLRFWYKTLFIMCLAGAGLGCFLLYSHSLFPYLLGSMFGIGFVIVTIITLVKQSQWEKKSSVSFLPWVIIGVFILDLIEGYSLLMMMIFKGAKNPDFMNNQIVLMEKMAALNHFDIPLALAADIVGIVAILIVGLAGLVLTGKNRLI